MRRYAGDDVQHVVVIDPPAPAPRRPFAGRRGRDEGTVEVTRATVVAPTPLRDPEAWLAGALEGDDVMREALAVLTRAVAAQRVAAGDPWLPDPDPARALVTRVGYGAGEEVAAGEWEVAREPPRRKRKDRRLLSPTERVAALLGGRDAALACEELTLRARADLDRERGREAALQLDVALRAALAELGVWREHRDMARRLEELASHRDAVAAAAEAALRGGLDDEQLAAVGAGLGRLEAALRARAVAS